ncbi:MAG: STAS domain-containing protein [Acidobacteriia bacterium]|nr:STAS domain-containing protein [Terriglobia bacterium]
MALEVKARKLRDVTVVQCAGRLVFGDETTLLRTEVKELLTKNPRIVLDFGEVRDIDSGGVGTLVGLYTSATAAGGGLKLARGNKKVLQTLSITRLLDIIRVYDRVEDAIAAFGSEPARAAQAS